LISKEGFEIAWTQYQGMMIERLNNLTNGARKPWPFLHDIVLYIADHFTITDTADAEVETLTLANRYAHSAAHASIFNVASMAHNNQFFFNCLSPQKTTPSSSFLADVENAFTSFDTLRTEMLETADAMFGNGFVWLFKDDGAGNLRIFCTYNAGSPWPQAHYRRQSRDMSNEYVHLASSAAERARMSKVQNTAGSFGRHAGQGNTLPSGSLSGGPILCVNVWQHAYLRDWGVAGKRRYLTAWWERIDWGAVEQNAALYGGRNMSRGLAAVLTRR
jgi:superoxide dismutase, Fe-Mn family